MPGGRQWGDYPQSAIQIVEVQNLFVAKMANLSSMSSMAKATFLPYRANGTLCVLRRLALWQFEQYRHDWQQVVQGQILDLAGNRFGAWYYLLNDGSGCGAGIKAGHGVPCPYKIV